jgi:hypothetical protein
MKLAAVYRFAAATPDSLLFSLKGRYEAAGYAY